MKYCFLVFVVLTIIACEPDESNNSEQTVSCIPSSLQAGILAFYPFNEGSLVDESLNSNDLINSTSAQVVTDRNGNSNCAFVMDNEDSSVEFLTTTKTDFLNDLDAFSISAWYQPLDATDQGDSYQTIVGRGEGFSCPERVGEWYVGTFDCRRVIFSHNHSVFARTISQGSCQDEVDALVDNWHHVVAVKDGDNFKLYFNGALDDEENGLAECFEDEDLSEDIGDLFIGKNFKGKVDDIIIYGKALSAAEVTELYELPSCCE